MQHLYKRNGYYYLITAEGGTGWGHAMTMARSRSLTGPYELHPDKYIVTARDRPHAQLHRAGHGDLVETQAGDTYSRNFVGKVCGCRPHLVAGSCQAG
jgi:xylan 1,4-beta-xylosidase